MVLTDQCSLKKSVSLPSLHITLAHIDTATGVHIKLNFNSCHFP